MTKTRIDVPHETAAVDRSEESDPAVGWATNGLSALGVSSGLGNSGEDIWWGGILYSRDLCIRYNHKEEYINY